MILQAAIFHQRITTQTPNTVIHIVGSQPTRIAVWKARENATSLLNEESRTFANATAKIQNSRNFQKRKAQAELFNHKSLSQAEEGHRWTRDYRHVLPNVTTSALGRRAEHQTPSTMRSHTKAPTERPAGCLYFLKLAFKSLWQMGEKYVIKVDISFLLCMFVKLILLSFTGRSVLNSNQTAAACS